MKVAEAFESISTCLLDPVLAGTFLRIDSARVLEAFWRLFQVPSGRSRTETDDIEEERSIKSLESVLLQLAVVAMESSSGRYLRLSCNAFSMPCFQGEHQSQLLETRACRERRKRKRKEKEMGT